MGGASMSEFEVRDPVLSKLGATVIRAFEEAEREGLRVSLRGEDMMIHLPLGTLLFKYATSAHSESVSRGLPVTDRERELTRALVRLVDDCEVYYSTPVTVGDKEIDPELTQRVNADFLDAIDRARSLLSAQSTRREEAFRNSPKIERFVPRERLEWLKTALEISLGDSPDYWSADYASGYEASTRFAIEELARALGETPDGA